MTGTAFACITLAASGGTDCRTEIKYNMTRQIFITILLTFLLISPDKACNCYLSDNNFYEDFRNMQYSCVGKVIKKIDVTHYEFEVLRVFKGTFEKTILIQSLPIPTCGLGELSIGDIYLISPSYIKEKNMFDVNRCNHARKNTQYSFKNDTTCLSAFSNQNTFLDVPYFKGQITEGKRQGTWHEYYYLYTKDSTTIRHFTGNFINDKREGVWTDENGIKSFYKEGKLMKPKKVKTSKKH